MIQLHSDKRIAVGALGIREFKRGCYVYVGSAMGGVEQRVRRHKSTSKKFRWHIDYLLAGSELIASIAIQTDSRRTECETAEALSKCEDATCPVPSFGSSGCHCPSHLFYFGEADPPMFMEMLTLRLSMLTSAYPRTIDWEVPLALFRVDRE